MNIRFAFVSLAVFFTCCLMAASGNAGTWAGFQRMDTGGTVRTSTTTVNNQPRVNRQGADDPANHDLTDDNGMDQTGNHQRRHRGRHRGPGR